MQGKIFIVERIFYVYHHINENSSFGEVGCRYIGKGKKYRAYNKADRNPHWKNIFTKDNRPTVVLIAENLTEEEAFEIEKQQIAFAREHGVKLCNLTDGGDGSCGHILSQEAKDRIKKTKSQKPYHHTEEAKERIRNASTGRKHTSDAREKQKQKALCRSKHTIETIEKIKETKRKRLQENPHCYKRNNIVVSLETREKMRIAKLGKKQSPEAIAKRTAKITGKKRSQASIEKYRIAATIREQKKKEKTNG